MTTDPPSSRRGGLSRPGRVLALFAMAAQAALPSLHEWQVARREAAHHLHAVAPAAGPALAVPAESGSRHEHHDPSSCGVCPALSRFRFAVLMPASAPAAPASRPAVLLGRTPPAARGLDPGPASPRGPPAAA